MVENVLVENVRPLGSFAAEVAAFSPGSGALHERLAKREEELSRTRAELDEAKADLGRDEQIFTQKLKEMKQLSEAHEALQGEHKALRAELERRQAAAVAQPHAARPALCRVASSPCALQPRVPRAATEGSSSRGGVWQMRSHTPLSGCSDASSGSSSGDDSGDELPWRASGDRDLLPIRTKEECPSVAATDESPAKDARGKETLEADGLLLWPGPEDARARSPSPPPEELRLSAQVLTSHISENQSIVNELMASERRMSEETCTLQEELQHTRVEMEAAEKQAGRSAQEKRALRAEYVRKLKETEAQLVELRRHQRAHEKASLARQVAERKISELKGETARMSQQQSSLRERLRTNRLNYEQQQQQREKEYELQLRTLKQENARQKEELQRKEQQTSPPIAEEKAPAPTVEAPVPSADAVEQASLERQMVAWLARKEAAASIELENRRRDAMVTEQAALQKALEILELRSLKQQEDPPERRTPDSDSPPLDDGLQREVCRVKEQLDEVSERISRKDESISALEAELSAVAADEDSLELKLDAVSLPVARNLLQTSFKLLQTSLERMAELRAEAKAQARECTVLEQAVADTRESFGRENFFYKHRNRDLKRELREANEALEEARKLGATADEGLTFEKKLNQQLRIELKNLRAFCEKNPAATPATVSKSNLREMPDALDSHLSV